MLRIEPSPCSGSLRRDSKPGEPSGQRGMTGGVSADRFAARREKRQASLGAVMLVKCLILDWRRRKSNETGSERGPTSADVGTAPFKGEKLIRQLRISGYETRNARMNAGVNETRRGARFNSISNAVKLSGFSQVNGKWRL